MRLKRGMVETEALHARLDGLLPPERMAAVERYLAEHPEERERWSDYAAHRQGLREALAMAPDEPIPQRLLRLARRLAEGMTSHRHRCADRGETVGSARSPVTFPPRDS